MFCPIWHPPEHVQDQRVAGTGENGDQAGAVGQNEGGGSRELDAGVEGFDGAGGHQADKDDAHDDHQGGEDALRVVGTPLLLLRLLLLLILRFLLL